MGELAAFLGIAILVIVTPGQDTALTIRNTMLGGRSGRRRNRNGSRRRPGVLDCRGKHRTGRAARRLGAGLRRAQAGRRRVPRVPRPPGAAPCDPPRHPDCRAGRRLAARCPPRVPPGPAEQPRQSEDGDLLHELAAAVRELIREPARTWPSLLPAHTRLAVRVLVRGRPSRRPAAATSNSRGRSTHSPGRALWPSESGSPQSGDASTMAGWPLDRRNLAPPSFALAPLSSNASASC